MCLGLTSGGRVGQVQCRESAAAVAAFDVKCRAELRGTPAHAGEATASALELLGVEANTVIGNADDGGSVATRYGYGDHARLRVLHRVVQGLLNDTKHPKRNLRAQRLELVQGVHVPFESN